MGIRLVTDQRTDKTVMCCTASGWAFGPVFDSEDEALHLLSWFERGVANSAAKALRYKPIVGDGTDPRDWRLKDMASLVNVWRGFYRLETTDYEEVA